MGILIGKTKKEYFVPNINAEFQLNSLIENSRKVKGEVSSNNINISSTETYNFNTYEKPIFTITGKISPKENGMKIDIVIDTYYAEELASFGMIILSILGLLMSLNTNSNSTGTRKGEFFEIGMVIVFLVAIFGLFRVHKRKKKGELEIENLISELKTFANNV